MSESGLKEWHRVVQTRDAGALDALLADDVVFHSPVVHTPQVGKAITKIYLSAALQVLINDSFEYVREVVDGAEAVLEFSLELDGIQVRGVDMIRFDDSGKIVDFQVMVRPLKGMQVVHRRMGELLAASP